MRLLVIGGLNEHIVAASKMAAKRGAKVLQADDINAALKALRAGKGADLILVDLSQDIKKLITSLRDEHIVVPVVACGITPDIEKATAAIKAGAKEYISLPPDEEVIAAIIAAISNTNTKFEIIYQSPQLGKIIKMAEQVAKSDATILITGESGTGKEVLSQFIHKNSKRNHLSMISINCAAVPENLLESELFGHEKGAFTGAVETRVGKFEEANGGTILLDEISEMDIRLQAKLLRAIQEREICRLGGNKPINLNIRIIATTNRNLIDCIKAGTFREDLYYRLNVIHLHVPPLRERREDIIPLTNFFQNKYTHLNGIMKKKINDQAIDKLHNSNWAGNIRELENVIHRAVLLCQSEEIGADDIMIEDNDYIETKNFSFDQTLQEIEKQVIIRTLQKYNNDYDKIANILGISLKTLKEKMKVYTNQISKNKVI